MSVSLRWSTADFADDPSAAAVAGAAESLNLEHHAAIVRAWYASDDREAWQNAPFSMDKWLRLTPAELLRLEEEIIGLLDAWAAREVPDDGQRRDPVFLFAYGVPGRP